MKPNKGWGAALVAALIASGAAAAETTGAPLSFIACPIARDTGPDTDLCFVAEHNGALYALVNPADFGNPQLHHQVLVEGRVRDTAQVCGAIPIEGRVSVLRELAPQCDQVLPFDGTVVGAPGGVFNTGPPEQRAHLRDLAERARVDPALSVQPILPDPPPAPPPKPPYETRSLTIFYPFDSDRASGPDMLEVTRLVTYARASRAEVDLISRAGASRLQDGTVLAERQDMARLRADKLAGIFLGLGLSPAALKSTVIEGVEPGTGIEDWRRRRIEISVRPQQPSSKQP